MDPGPPFQLKAGDPCGPGRLITKRLYRRGTMCCAVPASSLRTGARHGCKRRYCRTRAARRTLLGGRCSSSRATACEHGTACPLFRACRAPIHYHIHQVLSACLCPCSNVLYMPAAQGTRLRCGGERRRGAWKQRRRGGRIRCRAGSGRQCCRGRARDGVRAGAAVRVGSEETRSGRRRARTGEGDHADGGRGAGECLRLS